MLLKLKDRVLLPLDETGTIVGINEDIAWGFKYRVRIRKATFNKTNEIHDFKAEQMKLEGVSYIPKEQWGVHRTHCCLEHGCKYGYNDCPVALDLIKQDYKCLDC